MFGGPLIYAPDDQEEQMMSSSDHHNYNASPYTPTDNNSSSIFAFFNCGRGCRGCSDNCKPNNFTFTRRGSRRDTDMRKRLSKDNLSMTISVDSEPHKPVEDAAIESVIPFVPVSPRGGVVDIDPTLLQQRTNSLDRSETQPFHEITLNSTDKLVGDFSKFGFGAAPSVNGGGSGDIFSPSAATDPLSPLSPNRAANPLSPDMQPFHELELPTSTSLVGHFSQLDLTPYGGSPPKKRAGETDSGNPDGMDINATSESTQQRSSTSSRTSNTQSVTIPSNIPESNGYLATQPELTNTQTVIYHDEYGKSPPPQQYSSNDMIAAQSIDMPVMFARAYTDGHMSVTDVHQVSDPKYHTVSIDPLAGDDDDLQTSGDDSDDNAPNVLRMKSSTRWTDEQVEATEMQMQMEMLKMKDSMRMSSTGLGITPVGGTPVGAGFPEVGYFGSPTETPTDGYFFPTVPQQATQMSNPYQTRDGFLSPHS